MKTIKAEAFDHIFDEGKEDMMEYLDASTKRRINRETKKINKKLEEKQSKRTA